MTLREDIARHRAERDELRKRAAEENISPTQATRLMVLERLVNEAPTLRELPASGGDDE